MARETQNIPVMLDARMLGSDGTGVATYAQALFDALNAPGREPFRLTDRNTGSTFAPAGAIERWYRWCDALIDRPRRLQDFRARDIFRLAQVHFDRHGSLLRLRTSGPRGIMHWTYPLPLVVEGWINVYTVHDAIPLTHPMLTPIDGRRHRRLLTAILGHDGHMMTVSHAARQDIVTALGGSHERVFACPTGLDLPPASAETLPRGLTPDGFFLAIGSVEPRKNLLRLVEAWKASTVPQPLVIAGPSGWHSETIESVFLSMPGIVRLTYPSRAQLMALLAQSRALLFPSLAEGFGLPIVEAMALGTPVMTSRSGATEEIAGGAALLADPLSVADMADKIASLSRDATLVATLSAAGQGRVVTFTRKAFASRLDLFHRRLLQDAGWTDKRGAMTTEVRNE